MEANDEQEGKLMIRLINISKDSVTMYRSSAPGAHKREKKGDVRKKWHRPLEVSNWQPGDSKKSLSENVLDFLQRLLSTGTPIRSLLNRLTANLASQTWHC